MLSNKIKLIKSGGGTGPVKPGNLCIQGAKSRQMSYAQSSGGMPPSELLLLIRGNKRKESLYEKNEKGKEVEEIEKNSNADHHRHCCFVLWKHNNSVCIQYAFR